MLQVEFTLRQCGFAKNTLFMEKKVSYFK